MAEPLSVFGISVLKNFQHFESWEVEGRSNMSEQRLTPNLKDTEGPVIDFPRFSCRWSTAPTRGSIQSVSGSSDTSTGTRRCQKPLHRSWFGTSVWVSFLSAWPQSWVQRSQWCSVLTNPLLFCPTWLKSISVACNSESWLIHLGQTTSPCWALVFSSVKGGGRRELNAV